MAEGPEIQVAVGIEIADRRTFASALDWPGWSRSGRDDAAALLALDASRARYVAVVQAAGLVAPGDRPLDAVERRPGTAATGFGVPEVIFDRDRRPVDEREAARLAALVAAAWDALEAVTAVAPAVLRKGPRGGGRDRDAVVAHVTGAEASYGRQVGVRMPVPDPGDQDAVAALRAAILDVLRRPSDGSALAGRRWTQRYAARRIAWHALDHAWEIEDRSSGV
jgi:hypothetical protein